MPEYFPEDSSTYPLQVKKITVEDDVNPENANAAPEALAKRTDFLKALVETLQGDTYTKTEVDQLIASLINGAPDALNTLNELAAALSDNDSEITTLLAAINQRLTETQADARYLIKSEVIGSIIAFASQTAPVGWIECAGAELSRTAYLNLFSLIGTTFGEGDGSTTFNLPDLRGEFIRGWDNGRGVDDGRVFGSWQDQLFPNHSHGSLTVQTGSSVTVTRGNVATVLEDSYPRNVALIYCIKY